MISSKLTILSIVAVTIGTNAYADLSPNPWAEPNDKETIEEIYNKSSQKNNTRRTQYVPESTSEINISKRTIKRVKRNNSGGFSFGNLFSKKDEPTKEPANTPPSKAVSSPNGDFLGIKSGVNSIKRSIDNTINKTTNFYDRSIKNFQSSVKSLSKSLK